MLPAIAGVVIATHWPVLSAQALSFDDHQTLIENPLVSQPSLTSAWRFIADLWSPGAITGYYRPLAMISLMLDQALGAKPEQLLIFHITSLLLHVLTTVVLALLVRRLIGVDGAALAAALLFGLHPLTVEPIAWVSERKTLLATLFAVTALLAYVRHAQQSSRWAYVASIGCTFLALMSKPTSVPIPLMLVALNYWPLKRLSRRSLLDTAPHFALAALFGLITVSTHMRAALLTSSGAGSLAAVPLMVCHNIAFYLGKILWPVGLTSAYPYPSPISISNPAFVAGIIVCILLFAAIGVSLRYTRAVAGGFLILLLGLSPVIGLTRYSWVIVSDKYLYLPVVGLLLLLAWGIAQCRTRAARKWAYVLVGFIALAECVATRAYLAQWRTTESLHQYMIRRAPNELRPYAGLAAYYSWKGQTAEAVRWYLAALDVGPNNHILHNNLGNELLRAGRPAEAIPHFEAALRIRPDYQFARINLASCLAVVGQPDAAIRHLQTVLNEGWDALEVHHDLGELLLHVDRKDEAARHFEHIRAVRPDSLDAKVDLARVRIAQSRTEDALRLLDEALSVDASHVDAQFNRGIALTHLEQLDAAEAAYQRVLDADPTHLNARNNLANLYLRRGDGERAVLHYRKVLESQPRLTAARANLAVALAATGAIREALDAQRTVVAERPNNADAMCQLALLLSVDGQRELAIRTYQQVLKIAPTHAEARRRLAELQGATSAPGS